MPEECAICMDTIFPCEPWSQTECHPNRHMMHLDCYNGYLSTQRGLATRCPICWQFEIGEMEWHALGTIFGFDSVALEDIEQLEGEAYEYARRFQRGEVTQKQVWDRCDALSDQRDQ